METSAGLALGPQGPRTRRGEHSSKLWGNPFTNTKQASARAHKEQNQNLITLNQQHLEHTGDECAPCTRAARPKGTKGRAQLQTAGKRHTNTKRASARAHKEQSQQFITLNQQHLEHIGDECGPCTRAAGSKDTKGRAQLQTVGEPHVQIQSERLPGPTRSKTKI